jgi:hypothetical protein
VIIVLLRSEDDMANDIQSVIAKVQKLLRLSENNSNENECKAARAAADRLLQEYRLSMADLEAQGEVRAETFARKAVGVGGRRVAWKEIILSELCAHYGGCFYFSSGRSGGYSGIQGRPGSKGTCSYIVVAKESDLAIIEYMFSYLCEEVDRLGRIHCKGAGIKVAVSWRSGCALGIASQFMDMRAAMRASVETEARGCAMVLLDKRAAEAKAELTRVVPDLHTGTAITGGRDYGARSAGYTEGRKVSINQGLPVGVGAPKLT